MVLTRLAKIDFGVCQRLFFTPLEWKTERIVLTDLCYRLCSSHKGQGEQTKPLGSHCSSSDRIDF